MRIRVPRIYLLFVALLAGCADRASDPRSGATPANGDEVPAASGSPAEPDDAPDEPASPVQWTAGAVTQRLDVTGVAILNDVRIARNEGFDRVVLEFDGDELPSYHVEYVDRPIRQCGSGDVVPVAGDGWLTIRLEPAHAHDDEGRPTIAERDRRPDLPILRQVILICDFEAQVEWVLGVASPNRFRVMELMEPSRLVVDVRH